MSTFDTMFNVGFGNATIDLLLAQSFGPTEFGFQLGEVTPLTSPCGNEPSFEELLDLHNLDVTLAHSPLDTPLNELQQSMFNYNNSSNYCGWVPELYRGRRTSTPCLAKQFQPCQPLTQSGQNLKNKSSFEKPRRRSSVEGIRQDYTKPSTKVFACSEEDCTKVFKRSEHLKRHMKSIHSNEKPYVCCFPDCEKRFSRADNLSQHLRIHRNLNDKLKTKGFTSSVPYILPANYGFENQFNPLSI